ncbi:hypothetical protein LXL04_032667 [Taraxacum kok-saghyz]
MNTDKKTNEALEEVGNDRRGGRRWLQRPIAAVPASIAGSKSAARSRRSRPSEDVGEREAATAGKCRAVEEEKQRPEEKLRSAEDARSKVRFQMVRLQMQGPISEGPISDAGSKVVGSVQALSSVFPHLCSLCLAMASAGKGFELLVEFEGKKQAAGFEGKRRE